MKELFEILDGRINYLTGRLATSAEIELVTKHFLNFSFIEEFKRIIRNYKIIGQDFSLSNEEDFSGMGMEMEWLNPKQQVEEAFEYYPGIIVSKNDFIPIGSCLLGSGDPYFIKIDENNKWNVYRVYHDVTLDNRFHDDMKEFVIPLNKLFSMIGN